MRRFWIILTAILLAVSISGCENESEVSAGGPMIYYLCDLESEAASGGDAICAVPSGLTELEELETEEAALQLLQQLERGREGCISPLPAGAAARSVMLQGRRAYVDMTKEYSELTGVELSLADYCITLTLCQLEEIASVFITSEGRTINLRDNQVMLEQDVVLSGMEDVVSTVWVHLWFLNSEGRLSLEIRELELYEGQTMVEAVADALEEGPRDQEHAAIFPKGFSLGSVWMDDGVCCISIPKESMKALPDSVAEQEKILSSISRSYFSLGSVEELQLLVAGVELELFGHVPVEPYSYRIGSETGTAEEVE